MEPFHATPDPTYEKIAVELFTGDQLFPSSDHAIVLVPLPTATINSEDTHGAGGGASAGASAGAGDCTGHS